MGGGAAAIFAVLDVAVGDSKDKIEDCFYRDCYLIDAGLSTDWICACLCIKDALRSARRCRVEDVDDDDDGRCCLVVLKRE